MAKVQKMLFLDWDGTLTQGRYWAGIERHDYEAIQRELFIGNKPLVQDWMRGLLTGDDVCRWLEPRVNCSHDLLKEDLIASCRGFGLDAGTVEMIRKLRERMPVVLVTDNMDVFTAYLAPRLRLDKLFHEVVNSFDVRRLKNDNGGLTFKALADRFDVTMSDCVLIDDSAVTRQTFDQLGGESWATANPHQTATRLRALLKSF